MTVFLTICVMLLFSAVGVFGYLLWTMQQKLENVAFRLTALSEKVKEGEHVIIENFEIVEKKLIKLEHEIKDSHRAESTQRRKEIHQAAKVFRSANE